MPYTVKQVAKLAGISVRTLHHYDQIGLFRPGAVSQAGYRLYSEEDLTRLQQILFFRELDFPLAEIQQIMARPGFDRRQALQDHRRLLEARRTRLDTLLTSVARTLETLEGGPPMDPHDMFEGFDRQQLDAYREEAKARWGADVVEASYQRLGRNGKEGMKAAFEASGVIFTRLGQLMDRDPGDPEVQEQIDRWFRLINDRFYDCSLELFRGLGDMYVDDARFTATYDTYAKGLAAFKREAMHRYCDRRAAGS